MRIWVGRTVRFTKVGSRRPRTASTAGSTDESRLILLGCVSEKRDTPAPARDLYSSPLWNKRLSYAEASGQAWAILSAEHGLVLPDTELAPYDRSLQDEPAAYRTAWSARVADDVVELCQRLGVGAVEAHAGSAYLESGLIAALNRHSVRVIWPVRGMRIGEQLAWYGSGSAPAASRDVSLADDSENATAVDTVELIALRRIESFEWRWPDSIESFEYGWDGEAEYLGRRFGFRHGVGGRVVYGRYRPHTVIWVDGQPAVEGVGSDDFDRSRALLSLIKLSGGAMARSRDEIVSGYSALAVVDHRREIDAPYSRTGLAVKIRLDDISGWLLHAMLRRSRATEAAVPPAPVPLGEVPDEPSPIAGPPMPADHKASVASALAAFAPQAVEMAADLSGNSFAANPKANRLLEEDPFALLIAVISDYQVPAERAWMLPYLLKLRIGHLDPARMVAEPDAVAEAVARRPSLHRYTTNVPAYIVEAARMVNHEYGGDAANIWAGEPTAVALQQRLTTFKGISQKKAAMAVEILERDFGVPIREMHGSDIAFDVHLRRVFLRTGLAELDDQDHMVQAARTWWPERPGVLDLPAWVIGRTWCRPTGPDCGACPIGSVCARRIEAAAGVRGA